MPATPAHTRAEDHYPTHFDLAPQKLHGSPDHPVHLIISRHLLYFRTHILTGATVASGLRPLTCPSKKPNSARPS